MPGYRDNDAIAFPISHMLLLLSYTRKDGQFLARDPVTGENGCMEIAPEDVNCLARLQTTCTDLELTEDECDCPGQILITGDCSSFYSCFSRTRYDCGGKCFPPKKTHAPSFVLFVNLFACVVRKSAC